MGCATSAERGLRRRKSPFSPARRSSATHVHHAASLSSSSTVGSIKKAHLASNVEGLDIGRARKIVPRTPIRTPPGEPETINAWELMEGLEDGDGLASPGHYRSFSYNLPMPPELAGILGSGDGKKPAWLRTPDSRTAPETPEVPGAGKNPPQAAGLKFGVLGFSPEKSPPAPATPEILEAGKKGSKIGVLEFSPEKSTPALETPEILEAGKKDSKIGVSGFSPEKSTPAPETPEILEAGKKGSKIGVSGFSPGNSTPAPETPDIPVAGKKASKFGVLGFSPENPPSAPETPDIPGAGKKPPGSKLGVSCFSPENAPPATAPELAAAVVYFTSLRGVRRTYEDCRDVRRIIRSIGVKVDERDVSMDSGFRDELRELAGAGALPVVFVGGEYVGGAEEIRRLHEDGGLERVFDRCERVGGGVGGGACGGCGGVRFVPCEDCSGSCKVYCDGDGEGGEAEEFGFQRCRRCNENGLVRCPLCCCY